MKAEFSAFCQYATELATEDNALLSEGDLQRVLNSITSKGHGFIRDMDDLCNDIRLGLSRGFFQLSEHTNMVFERIARTVLPSFLGGALSRIFETNGNLREDFCSSTAARLIAFLSALKRVSPAKGTQRQLSENVWSTLKANFGDSDKCFEHFWEMMGNETFEQIMLSARAHFNRVLDKIPFEARLATPPGKNLDRYDASTATDWWLDIDDSQLDNWPNVKRLYRKLRRQQNHVPESAVMNRFGTHYSLTEKTRTLRRFTWDMKCSAQPKSYKAFRGVGVMDASRMMLQLSLQRSFYAHSLDDNLPLANQDAMKENLERNFEHIGTIDLSNASDRCWWWLLEFLGSGNPFFENCKAVATKELILPGGERIHCVSPVMGEAITFPLMSTLFTSVSLAVCDFYGWGHDLVKIYGDDIQSPFYEATISILRHLGAKPSATKSYPPESRFKESCEAHYIGDYNSNLRYARPAYIPSGNETDRGRIRHEHAFKLLILAKQAYRVCKSYAKSICDYVESRTSLKLPLVHFEEFLLGRPSETNEDSFLSMEMKRSRSFGISLRGHRRKVLQFSGSASSEIDPKVFQKRRAHVISQELRRMKYNDLTHHLEARVWRLFVERHYSSDLAQLAKLTKDLDCISWCRSRYTVEEFSTFIGYLELTLSGKLK